MARSRKLESSHSNAYKHGALHSKVQEIDLPTSAASIEDAIEFIKSNVIRAADVLSNCLKPSNQMQNSPPMDPALRDLLENTVKDGNVLLSTPDLALRAMLFCIVRDQIPYPDIWTALHAEGFMLGGYHRAIQHAGEH